MKHSFCISKVWVSTHKNRKDVLGFWLKFFLSTLLFAFSSSLFADTVILKNKTVHKGKVSAQNESSLTLKTKSGEEFVFPKRSILRVVYKDLNEQEVKRVIQEEEKKNPLPTKKEVSEESNFVTEPTEIPVEPQKNTDPAFQRNKWNVTWRSALLPGWGLDSFENLAKEIKNSGKDISILSQWKPILLGITTIGAMYTVLQLRSAALEEKAAYERNAAIVNPGVLYLSDQANKQAPGSISSDIQLAFLVTYNNSIFSPYSSAVENFTNTRYLGLLYVGQLFYSYWQGKKWEEEKSSEHLGLANAKWVGWNFKVQYTPDPLLNKQMSPSYQLHLTIQF